MRLKGVDMKKYRSEIGLLITALIWGSGFVASSMALEFYTPYQILALRFFIGSLILSLVFWRKIKEIQKSTLVKGIILGLFLYSAFALQTIGLQYTTPSKNAFLTAVNVIIVPFISFVLFKRKFDRYELMGAVLAMAGVGAISLQISGGVNVGDLLTLGCAVLFAFQIFYTSIYVQKEDPILLTLIQMVTATILGFVMVILYGETQMNLGREALASVVYLGVFSTTLAFLIQTVAQKYTSETKTAIILTTEAFWGTVLSVLILSEPLTIRMILGGILIFMGIIVSETKMSFLKKPYKGSLSLKEITSAKD